MQRIIIIDEIQTKILLTSKADTTAQKINNNKKKEKKKKI